MRYSTCRNHSIILISVLLLLLVFSGCSTLGRKSGRLSQISLLNALLLGEYDGFVTVGTLKTYGDIGIGTFDTLDGEMILLDGTVYQAKADGTVVTVEDKVLVPFAMAAHLLPTIAVEPLSLVSGIEAVKTAFDQKIKNSTNDFNRFYVVQLEGSFNNVRLRSVPAQEKPYQRLSTIASTQKEYFFDHIQGTIVAFRCPEYVQGINMPGWHLHFLSCDASKGGHLLEADIQEAVMEMGDIREYSILLPDSKSFASMDIAHDLSQETQAVEGMKGK